MASGRSDTVERPRQPALEAVRALFRAPTREVDCPTCGTANDAQVARWCGHCGERLEQVLVVAPSPRGPARDLTRLRMIVAPAFVLVVALLLLVPAALRSGGDTIRGQSVRGDAARTGVVADSAPEAPAEVVWTLETGAPVVPPTSIEFGTDVATVVNGSRLEVLDRATGQVLRTMELATSPFELGQARPFGGLLLAPGVSLGTLATIDLQSGVPRWETNLTGVAADAIASALPVEDDAVIVDGQTRISRLHMVTDGGLSWTTDLGIELGFGVHRLVDADDASVIAVTTSPAGAVLSVDSGESIKAGLAILDGDTGAIRWTRVLSPPEALQPVAASDRFDAGGHWLAHVALDRGPNPLVVVRRMTDGTEVGTLPFAGDLLGLAISDDVILLSATVTGTQAFDAGSGQELWTSPLAAGTVRTTGPGGLFLVRPPGDQTVSVLDTAGTVLAELQDVHPDLEPTILGPAVAYATTDGRITVRDLTGSPLWERPLVASGLASLVTDGTLAVVNGQGGTVVLDGRTGEQRISVERTSQATASGIIGSVAIDDGIVAASPMGADSTGRGLSAIVAETGIATWNKDGDQPSVVGPITVADGLAWIPVGDQIHGYDLANGRRAFAERGGVQRGPIVVTNDRLVVTAADTRCSASNTCSQSLVAIARQRTTAGAPREVLWSSDLPVCGPAAVRGEQVLVPTANGPTALDLSSGRTNWTAGEVGGCSALAVTDAVVVQAVGTEVRGWDVTTGQRQWSIDLGQSLSTQPVIAGEQAVVGTVEGDLVAVDTSTGELAWQYRLPAPALTDPVVIGERWVVLLRDGRVVRLR